MPGAQARIGQHGDGKHASKDTLAYFLERYQHEGIVSCIKRWALQKGLTEELIKSLERHQRLIKRAVSTDGDFSKIIQELKEELKRRERKRWCWWEY